jgi:hypothetical protein
MRFLVAVLSFVGFVAAQEGQTVTEGLLASQDDLGHSHLKFRCFKIAMKLRRTCIEFNEKLSDRI